MIDEAMVRHLAAHRGDPLSTTLYVDVDGSRYPRESDYRPHVDALVRLGRQLAVGRGARAVEAVEGDLDAVRRWLASGVRRGHTRGLAFFSCQRQGFFEVVPLAVEVRDQVALGPSFDVAQLCDALSVTPQALVVITDRHRSRLVRMAQGETAGHEGPMDEAGRRQDTDVELGSFERRHEEEARTHFRHVAQAVADEIGGRPAPHLVLGGTPEEVAAMEAFLPPGARAAVVGRVALETTASLDDIEEAADQVLREARRHHEQAMTKELCDKVEQGYGAVGGLSPTLRALADEQASTLVVERGLAAGGGRCLRCGLLVADAGTCPRCGATPDALGDVVGIAVTEAFAHHVAVEFCEPGALGSLDGIGALVRPGP